MESGAQDDRAVGGALRAERARNRAGGCLADLCVFDPETVIDRATFAEPTLPAAGIERLCQRKPCGAKAGRPASGRVARCAGS